MNITLEQFINNLERIGKPYQRKQVEDDTLIVISECYDSGLEFYFNIIGELYEICG